MNSEGQQNTLARYKIADAAQSGLVPSANPNVTIGYNGTQIYNTTNATVDPNAPTICGVPPGAAYWFSYTAPASGLMTVDTGGSAIATLLGAFTYTGTLVSYANLILLACDNNNGGTGTNATFSGTVRNWSVQAWADGSIYLWDDFTDLGGQPAQAFYRLSFP